MGVPNSVPSSSGPEKNDAFIGSYGNVADNINPIFGDHSSDNKKETAANVDQLELGAVLDELRRKNNKTQQKYQQEVGRDDREEGGSGSDSDDSDGQLRVGKLHRDRFKRNGIEDHQDVRNRLEEYDIFIEGDPIPANQLRLRNEAFVIDDKESSSKWYLSDDIGKLDVFKVLPFAEGVVCTIPVNAIGRNIKAECSVQIKEYRGKGYEATVGNAIDPITGEAVQSSSSVAGIITATIGPVILPNDWYIQFDQFLENKALEPTRVDLLYAKKEYTDVKMTVHSDHVSFRGLPKEFTPEVAEIRRGKSIKLNLAESIVKFVSSPPAALTIKVNKKCAEKFIIKIPNEPFSKLLFVWAFIMVCQATGANPDNGGVVDKKTLLQNWLERNKHHDLIT